ncbi:MAG: hybrid sensor histidine kinase/response regulator [Opitutaceae bacterium]
MIENTASSLTVPKLRNSKILIVDDEPRNLQLVGEILRRDGLKFIFATSGQDALQAVREELPAVILLDVMMPGMNGIEVCRRLKNDEATNKIPVIFLTAMSEGRDAVEGFAAGAVDYVRKPFISEELLARVHTHLELAKTQAHMRDLYQQKVELITTLAHDVKNPMAGVVGLSSTLKNEIEDGSMDLDEVGLILELMQDTAEGMLELVDGILNEERDASTNGASELPLQDVAAVVDHLVRMNALHARSKSITITFSPTFTPKTRLSRRTLTEMFDNLISNAVKYSQLGTTVDVRVSPSQSYQNGFRFEVADGALIIPEELRARLFTKYEMGGQDLVRRASSHGVGLSIVKRLVDLLDGDVGCSSRVDGTGNVFYIEIPIVE